MGIDYRKVLRRRRKTPPSGAGRTEFRDLLGAGRKIILSIDRLDYSKGIPERLRAFDLFLRENPQVKDKAVLILVAVPSRTEVSRYKDAEKTRSTTWSEA